MVANDSTGGQAVARALAALGGEVIFSVSGNQVLPIYDAAGEAGLRIIHMRHESAAVYAAAAWAELRDDAGIALVSAGPGFLAALTGAAVAHSMELPLLLLSGAAPVAQRGWGAFQDLDQSAAALAACKASYDVSSGALIYQLINTAFEDARDDIPGPVHVSLPADVLLGSAPAERPPLPMSFSGVEPDDAAVLNAMLKRLEQAKRPVVIARPSAQRGHGADALHQITFALGVTPLITESPRGLSDLKYAAMAEQLAETDCALIVAPADFAVRFLDAGIIARDGDILLIDAPGDPAPTRTPTLHCRTSPQSALAYLAEHISERVRAYPPIPPPDWSVIDDGAEPQQPHPLAVARAIRESISPHDCIVLDGGEFCQWVRLGLRDLPNRMLWNGKLGAIGGSIPLAIGAAVAAPTRRVLAILGDGSAGYHLSEFETAARFNLPITAIIGNDARWAAEWHQQRERYGPERAFDTTLLPARYDRAAAGFGANAFDVSDEAGLRIALASAFAAGRPACINVTVRSVQSPAVVH